MALGRRDGQQQGQFWIPAEQVARGPGHPFYRKLNEVFAAGREGPSGRVSFDRFVEGACKKFYADQGRPGVPPGVYFRMLLIGFFEGIDSERGIDWRCSDSLTLREFLGYALTQATPDHSTVCTIRQRIDVETHREVFTWVLALVADSGLLKGKTLGIDATTLEANAAMRSIVRRDTGESYEQFLAGLAKASGIATPTREDLAKIDKKRKNKASNKDWENPNDPDAKITKMKDGRTHLAHKAEHAVDMETGAVVAVTLQPADVGDTTTIEATVEETFESLLDVREHGAEVELPSEAVADKGYHSNESCVELESMGIRSYVSEPDRGRRVWTDEKTGEVKSAQRDAVYANRRRIRGEHGKRLLRGRGELVERSFAHCYETGAMRRTHLRGHPNILKRLLIHVAGFNLALVLRAVHGLGKPRTLQDGLKRLLNGQNRLLDVILGHLRTLWKLLRPHLALPELLGPGLASIGGSYVRQAAA
jgi:transposase